MQPRGRFWGGSPGLQVQYFFFSVSRRGAGGFTGTGGKLPIRFDSFLFGWMKIFHPSCQSLAFSALSAYYYNKNPSRFLCRFAHRVQKGAHCHDHHGAKSRTAQSRHCGPPGVVGHPAHPLQRRSLRPHHGSGLLQKGRKHPALPRPSGGEADFLGAGWSEAARQAKTPAYPSAARAFR